MNILLVDDDRMIRSWLTIMLRQAGVPQENLFEAENGKDALDVCAARGIDLVVTDLEMPALDGLQLLSQLNERFPAVKTAVLTSYPDYEYVRTALRFNAIDYIVKPLMTLEDILSLLDRYRCEEYASASGGPDPQTGLRQLKEYLSSGSLTFQIGDLDFPEGQPVCCCCVQLQASDALREESGTRRFLSICQEYFRAEKILGRAYILSPVLALLLYHGENAKALHPSQYYERLSMLLDHSLSQHVQSPLKFHSFRVCGSPPVLKKQLSRIFSVCEAQTYYHDPSLTDVSALNEAQMETACLKIQNLLLNSAEEAPFSYSQWLQELHKQRTDPEQVKKALRQINASLLATLRIHAFHVGSELPQAVEQSLESLEHVRDFQGAEALTASLEKQLGRAAAHEQQKLPSAIQACIEYIERNYAAPIQLDDIAKHVHLNSAYLSFLFKKHTGISFIRFLEYVRIRQAKRLLQTTSLSITEIAEAVGFSGQNYFSKVFRRVVGCNPSGYRSRVLQP